MLASLDVESLFTNVPVIDTIKIILENDYNSDAIAPPMHCTKEYHAWIVINLYHQDTFQEHKWRPLCAARRCVDGYSPLGPTFASFYMCQLENNLFSSHPNSKPHLYVRYVDDICIVVGKFEKVINLINLFKAHSVLKFTFDWSK